MALFEVLIPQLMKCSQSCGQSINNLMDQDWNHWKLQVQSWMEDAQVAASKAAGTGAFDDGGHCSRGADQTKGCPGGSTQSEAPNSPLDALHQMWSQFGVNRQQRQRAEREEASNNLVKDDGRKHVIKLDVSNFEANEISVKLVDNQIVVDGEHPERTDRLGRISRKFQRKFEVPSDVEPQTIVSTLTPSGVLIIEGLKKRNSAETGAEIVIPVIREQTNTSSDDTNSYENEQQMD